MGNPPEILILTGFPGGPFEGSLPGGDPEGTLARDDDTETVTYVPAKSSADQVATAVAKAKEYKSGSRTELHMQNLMDRVRSRKEPDCLFEIGFRSAIAFEMAVASYRQGRGVHWDAEAEQIV